MKGDEARLVVSSFFAFAPPLHRSVTQDLGFDLLSLSLLRTHHSSLGWNPRPILFIPDNDPFHLSRSCSEW